LETNIEIFLRNPLTAPFGFAQGEFAKYPQIPIAIGTQREKMVTQRNRALASSAEPIPEVTQRYTEIEVWFEKAPHLGGWGVVIFV
jgi:hypothetical protein